MGGHYSFRYSAMRQMKTNGHNSLKDLVGAPGFEPGASCAQGRRSTQNKPPVSSASAETKQLSCDRSMWLAVRRCAHLSVGWAQKPAQSRSNARPGNIRPSVQSSSRYSVASDFLEQ